MYCALYVDKNISVKQKLYDALKAKLLFCNINKAYMYEFKVYTHK